MYNKLEYIILKGNKIFIGVIIASKKSSSKFKEKIKIYDNEKELSGKNKKVGVN